MPRRKAEQNKYLIQFGKNLYKLRLESRLSQEDLGFLVGLHRTTIGELERGEQNVSLLNIIKLAGALDCKIDDLFLDLQPTALTEDQIKDYFAQQAERVLQERRAGYTSGKKGRIKTKGVTKTATV